MNKRYMDFVPVKKDTQVGDGARGERATGAGSVSGADRAVDAGRTTRTSRAVDASGITRADYAANAGRVGAMAGAKSQNTLKQAPTKVPRTGVVSGVRNSVMSSRQVGTTASGLRLGSAHGNTVKAETTKKAKLGVIEDLGPRFVTTAVEKRPLSGSKNAGNTAARELKEAKAEKLVGGRTLKRTLAVGSAKTAKMPVADGSVKSAKMSVADGAMTRMAANSVARARAKTIARPASGKTELVEGRMGVEQGLSGRKNETSGRDGAKTALKLPKFVNTEKVAKRPLSKNVYTKKVVTPKEEPKGPVTIIAKPEKDSRVGMIVAIIITIILGATAGTVAFLLLPK